MGVNRRFQAKRAKNSIFCIIKTTNAIATKFCTVIKTIKFSLWVVPKFAQQIKMADGLHLEKMTKLLYFSNGLTAFYKILHADAHWPSEP